jgi:predicted enzyme related to lactoylglutathione lyase
VKAEAVVYVKHLQPMCSFYEHSLGLKVAQAGESYCVLESEAWRLSLVAAPDKVAATIHISVPARRRDANTIKLAFQVPRIDVLRATAAAVGGQIDPPNTEWDFCGFRRCDGIDPEGNVIQLLESLASQT